jgi:hypothetical protein
MINPIFDKINLIRSLWHRYYLYYGIKTHKVIDHQENKYLVYEYLVLSIRKNFNLDISLLNEYILVKNIVSKSRIIVPTFSDKITNNPRIKVFLTALILGLNHMNYNITDLKKDIEYLKNSDSKIES